MSEPVSSSTLFASFGWRILQQYGGYFVKLIVQIVLARVLDPADFGIIATTLAFITIAEVLAISGLGTALVQKKEPDEKDYGTVLVASLALAFLLYAALFFAAPAIAAYYEYSDMTAIIRMLGIVIIVQSIISIQTSYVLKHFLLKKSFVATLVAALTSGVTAIVMAFIGFGVWALVAQSLLYSVASSFGLLALTKWFPKPHFDPNRFMSLFSFSWKVLLSSLIGTLLENLYSLTIGKLYGSEKLGYYNQGNAYPAAIVGQTRTAISSLLLPYFSTMQDNREQLLASIKRMTHFNAVIILPLAFGLAAAADAFVVVLLSEKWLPCVFFLRLECVFYGCLAISSSLGNGIMSVGRSDLILKVEAIKLAATVGVIAILGSASLEALCIARVLIAVGAIAYSVVLARRLLGYSFKDLAQDTAKPIVISCVMGAFVYLVSAAPLPAIAVLLIQIVLGVVLYILGCVLFLREDLVLIRSIIISKGASLRGEH